jgi:phosphoglycerate dehydrogenase-like enzyme
MKDIVLITNQVPESVTAPIKDLAVELRMGGRDFQLMSREEVLTVSNCVAIINQAELQVDAELLSALPRLKVVSNISIGIDNLDLAELDRRGIWASNAPGYFAQPVAEYVLTGLLVLSRRIREMDSFVRSGEWRGFEPGRWDGHGLFGRTLGIIGYGRIGNMLACYAEALGMKVLTYDCNDGNECFRKLLTDSDYISVHVPLLPDTRDLLSARELSLMKPGTVLANASRGGVVNQQALIAALQSGHLGGAILDVFACEPTVPAELRERPNVLLSPHAAGGTCESREAARLCAFRNVAAALSGETPPNAVNHPKRS